MRGAADKLAWPAKNVKQAQRNKGITESHMIHRAQNLNLTLTILNSKFICSNLDC